MSVKVTLRSITTEVRTSPPATASAIVLDRICARTASVTVTTINKTTATTTANVRHDVKARGCAVAVDVTANGNERTASAARDCPAVQQLPRCGAASTRGAGRSQALRDADRSMSATARQGLRII